MEVVHVSICKEHTTCGSHIRDSFVGRASHEFGSHNWRPIQMDAVDVAVVVQPEGNRFCVSQTNYIFQVEEQTA